MKPRGALLVGAIVLFVCIATSNTFGQGVVTFNNNVLTPPPDRLVRDSCGDPLFGTNYIAQLYYGSTPDSLVADTQVSRFRPLGSAPAGTWVGGTRTLIGVGGIGTTVYLQVKVWDILSGPTFNQARAAGGAWGQSQVFTYMQTFTPAADDTWMKNFAGFSLAYPPCPPTNHLAIENNNNTISLTFRGLNNIEVSDDLRSWTTLGAQQFHFVDTQAASLSQRFYRMNNNGVYSDNAVGFYRLALCAGFSLIANQLNRANNKVTEVILNPPDGTRAYKFNPQYGVFVNLNYVAGLGWDDGGSGTIDITAHPGEGIFLYAMTPFTNTFFGEIRLSSSVPLGTGFTIISSPVPQAGPIEPPPPIGLAFPIANGDQIYRWNCATGYYITDEYVAGIGWSGDSGGAAPVISIGEAFWLNRSSASAGSWNRTFSVGP
jgi:hypothetical protein